MMLIAMFRFADMFRRISCGLFLSPFFKLESAVEEGTRTVEIETMEPPLDGSGVVFRCFFCLPIFGAKKMSFFTAHI